MGWFESKLTKALKKVKAGDTIKVNCPAPYVTTIGNAEYADYPADTTVINNDPVHKKIFLSLKLSDGNTYDHVFPYNDKCLRNFIVLNKDAPRSQVVLSNSKTDLHKALAQAISREDFETAKLINQKIKEAK